MSFGVRSLLPDELETITNAIKSQLSKTGLDNKYLPSKINFESIYIEYDIGSYDIEYRIDSSNIEEELSIKMKILFANYFNIKFKK